MMYSAVRLCPDGGVVRHPDTQEVANETVGDFDSIEDAIKQACETFKCIQLKDEVISKGRFKGGYMVVSTQELEAV
ncbi:hypothetical protein [Vibrio sp. HN007]|uniref:hypothetical protein n=1 Tax=Vibrio iocasae TaxID=3098914 RepID=UPI0035D4AB2F